RPTTRLRTRSIRSTWSGPRPGCRARRTATSASRSTAPDRAAPLRRAGGWTAAEESGFAVAFGFIPVVGLAFRFEVLARGRAAVRDTVDVVVLEPVSPIAAVLGTGDTLELRCSAEHECGL